MSEQDYINGNRQALTIMLRHCCRELGYDDFESRKVSWIAEREEAILALRDICKNYGDNDWNHNLHLADIIQKHLHRHLEDNG